ncbi:MAG: phytanoyl-CoA dioxygenase family protein [Chloroflexi bacterium]|nr:phytanoyl-CoA dioxygenase family protein [Chloroflexota bacterium]
MALITDKQVQEFREQGYFVTEPAFSKSELAAVTGEFQRLWDEFIRSAEEGGDSKQTEIARFRPFIGQVHTRSAVMAEFVKAPIYLEACERLIGPDADLYYNQAVIKPPEKGRHFGWHQDSGYTTTEPLEYVTCWTAISRTFVENGCIWVLPRSHRQGVVPHRRNEVESSTDAAVEDESGAIPVEMAPGQVAIFSSLLLHKSGPNTSREVRMGYVPQYHSPTVRMVSTGQPWGDRFPVLRDGKRC